MSMMKNMLSKNTNDRSRQQAGFALIITISILGFLVVVVLSLASMLRVSTSISDFEVQQTEIRQYAWAAAMQGLAKLQVELGGDRSYSALSGGWLEARPAPPDNPTDTERNWLQSRVRNASYDNGTQIPISVFDARDHVTGAWQRGSDDPVWLFLPGAYRNAPLNSSNFWKEIVPGVETRLYRRDPTRAIPTNFDEDDGNVLYTYWVDDLGVKATLRSFTDASSQLPSTFSSSEITAVKGSLSMYQHIDAVLPFNNAIWTRDPNSGVIIDTRIPSVDLYDVSQAYYLDHDFGNMGDAISLPAEVYNPDFSSRISVRNPTEYNLTNDEERKEASIRLYHTLGLQHTGLLTNPDNVSNQGLKLNLLNLNPLQRPSEINDWLAHIGYRDTSFDSNSSFPGWEYRKVYNMDPTAPLPLAPRITDFRLYFEVDQPSGSGQPPQMKIALHVQLWNPYTSSLTFPNGKLRLRIDDLPITIELQEKVGTPPSTTVTPLGDVDLSDNADLVSILGGITGVNINGSIIEIDLNFPTPASLPTPRDAYPAWIWEPGRTYSWWFDANGGSVIIEDNTPGAGVITDIPLVPLPSPFTPQTDPSSTIEVEYRFGTATPSIELELDDGTNVNVSQTINFTSFNAPPNIPFTDLATINAIIGYQVRMFDPGYYHPNPLTLEQSAAWLYGDWDIRDPNFGTTTNPGLPSSSSLGDDRIFIPNTAVGEAYVLDFYSPGSSPNLDTGSNGAALSMATLYGRNDDEESPVVDFPLFELPRENPSSIASLQHVHHLGESPFRIGSPGSLISGGVNENSYFDDYFFRDADSNNRNPRYRKLNPAGSEDADNIVVEGAFNINSVSVAAWEAILRRGLIEDWEYVNLDTGNFITSDGTVDDTNPLVRAELHNAFMRFSQSAQETFYNGDKPGAPRINDFAPREYFRRGVREFTNAQIRELAEKIVYEVHEYQRQNRPFNSMREFVDEGILQKAINAVGLNKTSAVERVWDWADSNGQETDTGNLGTTAYPIAYTNEIYIDDEDPNFISFADGNPGGIPYKVVRDDNNNSPNSSFVNLAYSSGGNDIWPGSSFYLTQADVLSAIDPFLQVRSDTFTVRGYAEQRYQQQSGGSLQGVVASAMVELLVQRTYDRTPIASNNRAFKIIGVRWIEN